MTNYTEEVRYDIYCRRCKHWDLPESEDPCFTCLDQPTNEGSKKPVKYEEGDKNSDKLGKS